MFWKNNNKGFTLIELLVVIGILAVLLAITLIAINPGAQLQQADDTKRKSDINAILNGVNQWMVNNNGQLPSGVGATALPISNTDVNLCTLLVPDYMAALPQDPASNAGVDITNCASYNTGYEIQSTNSRITIIAPDANGGAIQVTR